MYHTLSSNNYTYNIKLLYPQWFDYGDRQMIYTLIISLVIEKPFYLLRTQSFSCQILSEFIDKIVKFSNYVPGVGLLTPSFVTRGGVLYKMIVPGGGNGFG